MGRTIPQPGPQYDELWRSGLGTGIAPLRTHPAPTHPGTPPLPLPAATVAYSVYSGQECGVGLKSVAQLTLDTQISDIRTITEVYNLANAGIPNDHLFIAGND